MPSDPLRSVLALAFLGIVTITLAQDLAQDLDSIVPESLGATAECDLPPHSTCQILNG